MTTENNCVCVAPSEPQCGDRHQTSGHICTRKPNHDGDHIACKGFLHGAAVWPRHPSSPAPALTPLEKLVESSANQILDNQALRHAGAELLQHVHDLKGHQKSIQFCPEDPCTRMYELFVKGKRPSPSSPR